MPDINGIMRKNDFDTDTELEGRVRDMMASLTPAMSNFAVQKGIDFDDGKGIYPVLVWKEMYTPQEDGWRESILRGQITVMKRIIIHPAQNLQGLLCVKISPSAMKVSGGTAYSPQRWAEEGFTQASEESLLGPLNRAYDYLRSLKLADIEFNSHEMWVLV